eukprot:gene2388-biopygen460
MRKNFQTSGFLASKLYGQLPVKFMPFTGNLRAIYGELLANLRAIYWQSMGNHRITGNFTCNYGQSTGNSTGNYGQLYGQPPDYGQCAVHFARHSLAMFAPPVAGAVCAAGPRPGESAKECLLPFTHGYPCTGVLVQVAGCKACNGMNAIHQQISKDFSGNKKHLSSVAHLLRKHPINE